MALFGLFILLTALAGASPAPPRQVIVLPAGAAADPGHRQATILDVETWKPIGQPEVGMEAYDAFTLPDGSKTYVVSKSTTHTVTVLGDLAAGGQVLKSLDLATGLSAAALSPDGKRLLVVSMTDAALTIINTATDRVIARIALAAPANDVVVGFESSRAFTVSPRGAMLAAIDLGRNIMLGSVNFGTRAGPVALAPDGLLYWIVDDRLYRIDPDWLTFSATAIQARGVAGRPWFTNDGSRMLLSHSLDPRQVSVSLFRLSDGQLIASAAGPPIDQIRIVSSGIALGVSTSEQRIYRFELNSSLALARLGGLDQRPVTALGGSHEEPLNRHLFLSSGNDVFRVDTATGRIVASHALDRLAGPVIQPSTPSRAGVASVYGVSARSAVSMEYPSRLVVRALDAEGLPIGNLRLSVTGNVLTSFWTRTSTNSQGYALVPILTYPHGTALPASVEMESGLAFPVAAAFLTDRKPDPASCSLTTLRGNRQLAYPGGQAVDPLEVRATDRSGTPCAGLMVGWSITDGPGKLKFSQTLTDAEGIAANPFTAGPLEENVTEPLRTNIQTFGVGAAQKFLVITLPTVPANPSGPIPGLTRLRPLGPLSISVLPDSYADVSYRLINPSFPFSGIAGVSLELRVAGQPSHSWTRNVTDWAGHVSFTAPTLRPLGQFKASVYLGGRYVEDLSITVLPGQPESLRIVSGNGQRRRPGTALDLPLVAVVEDRFGNPVNNAQVSWSVESGAATLFETVSTSTRGEYRTTADSRVIVSDGLVSTRVRLDESARSMAVKASLGGSRSATFVLATSPFIWKLDGDQQSAMVGSHFLRPLVVEAIRTTWSVGSEWRGVPITFSAPPELVLSHASPVTDSLGRAEVSVTAGTKPGRYVVTASTESTSETFTLTVTPPER